jgi:sigma-B regulation protein RsbU (phosphoserine phosphatase)
VRSRLRQLLQAQQRLVFVAVLVYAVLTALKTHVSFALIISITLGLGNIFSPLMVASHRIYEGRQFPWNWILFLPIQAAAGVACAFAAPALLLWFRVYSTPYWIQFRDIAPLVMIAVMATGIVTFAVGQVQRRLQEHARQLETQVEKSNVRLHVQEQELERALEIQRALLPKTLPQLPGVQLAGAWQPARIVGGDYFDVIRLDHKRLGICIGDVAGKGISAALLMANLQASFRALATADAPPSAVCAKLNAFLCSNLASGKFITLFYGILDAARLTITYESAGHCPAFLLKKSGHVEALHGEGAVLGVLPDWTYRDSVVPLAAGDRLLLYTDGVTEAENHAGEEFGEARLLHAARLTVASAEDLQRKIMKDVSSFCEASFADDATLVVATLE